MLVDEVDVDAVLGGVNDTGLQRGVDAAERHVHGLGAVGREYRILRSGRLNANFHSFEVPDVVDFPLAVDVANALRAGGDDVQPLRGLVDHRLDGIDHLLVGERLDHMIGVSE